MNRKSKLLTFILSFIPGLGQVYLGYTVRGLIFLAALAGIVAALIILGGMYWTGGIFLIFLFFLPVIWLVAMVDSMILVDRINSNGIEDTPGQNYLDQEDLKKQNRKILAMVLSVIPGAGHMYLELQRQGLQLMTMFFFIIFVIDFLQLSFLMFALPIIWFFGVFDTLKKVSSEEPLEDDDIILLSWIKGEGSGSIVPRDRIIGYGLIGLGVILILNRIALPMVQQYIDWRISQYARTGLTALLFIIGGLKMLAGSKGEKNEEINGGEDLCGSGE